MLSFLVWVTIAPILLGSVFIHLFYKHLLFTMYKWNTYMENGNSAFKELSVQWKESKVDSRVETYIYISVYISQNPKARKDPPSPKYALISS